MAVRAMTTRLQSGSVTPYLTAAQLPACWASQTGAEKPAAPTSVLQARSLDPAVRLRIRLPPVSGLAQVASCARGLALLRHACGLALARVPGRDPVAALPQPGRDAAVARRSARLLRQPRGT
jgi:hypothetical protein